MKFKKMSKHKRWGWTSNCWWGICGAIKVCTKLMNKICIWMISTYMPLQHQYTNHKIFVCINDLYTYFINMHGCVYIFIHNCMICTNKLSLNNFEQMMQLSHAAHCSSESVGMSIRTRKFRRERKETKKKKKGKCRDPISFPCVDMMYMLSQKRPVSCWSNETLHSSERTLIFLLADSSR